MSVPLRVVCISDTHLRWRGMPVPPGDVLVHAGDLTMRGSYSELALELEWLRSLPHPHKVLVAGNHDFVFQREPERARGLCRGLTYLEDEETTAAGLRIYGSPWQPWFHDWAFNLQRGAEIRAKWDLIPTGIDLLVTHGPPLGIGDRTRHGQKVGCADLLEAVRRTRPRLHVFGHIHEDQGRWEEDGTVFVNACVLDVFYRPSQAPIVVELP